MYSNERPMKRAHSPDQQFDLRNQIGGRPGPPGYGRHQFHKRHRGDRNDTFQPLTIEEKISKLGETGSRNSDIGVLAKEIDNDLLNKVGDEEKVKSISSKICRCIISFPTRIATYSTLIGLISVKHYNVSCQIINTLHASYPVYLEAQKWQEALTIIHLLSSLVNCKVIRPSALLSQFELLLEITLEDNIPQARSDYYVYTVLSSLPYVALELSTQPEQDSFEQLINTIETYLSKRSKEHLNVTRIWLSSDSTIQMDYLDSLWVQMKNFRANNWNETFLHRPYNDKEYKDTMASSLILQNSPTIQIPAHCPDFVYPSPRIVFRIFEDDVVEGAKSIPGSDKIERFCVENHIRNIIDEIPTEPRDCARHLNHMYRSDQLPMKHILVETLLGELFTLPRPKHPEILYQALIRASLRHFNSNLDNDKDYLNVVNEAVKILVENLETMNVTCFDRFVDWISFHLNDTNFMFPWQSWADANYKDKDSPKAVFVNEVIGRIIRFSYYEKIAKLIGNEDSKIESFMPPATEVKFQPVFGDHPKANELAISIKKLITNKAGPPEFCETLNINIEGSGSSENFVPTEEKHSDKLLKIDIFICVLLDIGSKSLTHMSSGIGKYRGVIKKLIDVEQGQYQLLRTLHSCLESHPQILVILVDKLLKAELFETKQVCSWIFSDPMKPYHLKSYPWEILHNTSKRIQLMITALIKKRDAPIEDKGDEKEGDSTKTGDIEVKMEPPADVEMRTDNTGEFDEEIAIARATYHELMIQIFTMFAGLLGEHITKCEIAKKSYMDAWFKWITGRMQQVYYNHYDSIQDKYEELKAVIDRTPSIGSSIVNLNQ